MNGIQDCISLQLSDLRSPMSDLIFKTWNFHPASNLSDRRFAFATTVTVPPFRPALRYQPAAPCSSLPRRTSRSPDRSGSNKAEVDRPASQSYLPKLPPSPDAGLLANTLSHRSSAPAFLRVSAP